MTTQSATRTHTPGVIRSRGLTLVVAALGFVGFYLSTEVALGSLASTSLPLPTDPVAHARDWFASNQQAAVVMGLLQVLSVACLATFVWALHDSMSTTAQRTATARARPWGWLAVGLMVASSALAWLMAALAPTSWTPSLCCAPPTSSPEAPGTSSRWGSSRSSRVGYPE
jgi:hypothetical protein